MGKTEVQDITAPRARGMRMNMFTVDVEDWYQSSQEILPGSRKGHIVYPSERVVLNTEKILALLRRKSVYATFFVLGTVAEKYPGLEKKIQDYGHEIASHGYAHHPVYTQTPGQFREDILRSVEIIESITHSRVTGYRAPYFSIREDSLWALDVLSELGFTYDASIFPLPRARYGVNTMPDIRNIAEIPASKVRILGCEMPCGGGGYLRLYPYSLTRWALGRINSQGYAAMVYVHPYEIDTEDPWQYEFPRKTIIRYTQNFGRVTMMSKLNALLDDFSFTGIKDYITGAYN